MRASAPMSSAAATDGEDHRVGPPPRLDRAAAREPSRRALGWFVCLLGGGAVLLVARHPDLFTRPALWAEDGNLLMHDALIHGAVRTVTHPYNGTFIVFQRLVAELVTVLPVRFTPVAYSTVSLLAALLASGLVLRDAMAWMIPSRGARIAAFAALLVVPGTREVLGNLVNTVWYGALALLVLSLSDDPERDWTRALEIGVVILAGLSGPSVILLVPLFWLRARRTRTRHSVRVVLAASAVAVAQIACLTFVTSPADGGRVMQTGIHHLAPGRAVSVLLERVGGAVLFGDRRLVSLWGGGGHHLVVWAGAVAGASAIIAGALLAPRRARFPLIVALATTCVSVVLAGDGDLKILAPPDLGLRYVFLPLSIAVIAIAAALTRLARRGSSTAVAAVVLPALAAVTGIAHDVRLPAQPDIGWSRSAACIAAHQPCHVPINPRPWSTEIPPIPSAR